MLNHDGTDAEVWNPPTHAPVPIPGGGMGGPPTIADMDGDGVPEIGVAGQVYYTVFNRDGSVRWKSAIRDRSSNSTGSTVFDFDGDGSVEVVYRDELFLRVYRARHHRFEPGERLCVHDRVVPYAMGEQLFDLANQPKHFVRFLDGGHEDLDANGALDAVGRFLAGDLD